MRVVAQDMTVVAGTRLGLVGVARQVFLTRRRARHERPFQAGWKTRATASAQGGVLDRFNNFLGRDFVPENLFPGAPAADLSVGCQRPALVLVKMGEDDVVFSHSQSLQLVENLVDFLGGQVFVV